MDTKISITKSINTNLQSFDKNDITFGKNFTDHMAIIDFDGKNWVNSRIIPIQDLSVHPSNVAWHYGQSIFEGLKAYKNNQGDAFVFRPSANLVRLNQSAERMCMPKMSEDLFMDSLLTLLKLDKEWIPDLEGTSLYIRPFMVAWDATLGVRASDTYRFMIICSPASSLYSGPIRVKIETKYSRSAPGGTGHAKAAGNYAGSMYPTREAHKEGFQQIIWTDSLTHTQVEEAGTMNLMFLCDGILTTPPISDTILDGITRRSIIAIAKDWGIEVKEREVNVFELTKAIEDGLVTEAFGVGTAATIAQIKTISLNGKDYDLPEINKDTLHVRLNTYLQDLREGRVEDKFGWMISIK